MTATSFIIPVLTAITLFLFVFSSQRAWLPLAGTTEWIRRSVFKVGFSLKDLVSLPVDLLWAFIAFAVAAALSLFAAGFSFEKAVVISCCSDGVATAAAFLAAKHIFRLNSAACFSAFIAYAAIFPVDTDISCCFGALYMLFALLSVSNPLYNIPAGIFAGAAAAANGMCVFLLLFGVAAAVSAYAVGRSKAHLWMFFLFGVILAAAVFAVFSGGSVYGFINDITSITYTVSPVYGVAAVVFAVCAFCHIFKDKSIYALVIFVGVILMPQLFLGISAAYLGSIIIKRGKPLHKASMIAFGCVVFISLALSILESTDILSLSGNFTRYLMTVDINII